MDIFNSNLEKIQVFRKLTFEDSPIFFMNELEAIIFSLKDSLMNMNYNENTISEAKAKLDRYFTFDNSDFCALYNKSFAEYFGDITYTVEQSKDLFFRCIGIVDYFVPVEKAIDYLMECKDEYEAAKKASRCAEIPVSEIKEYYKNAIMEHSEELIELIFNNEILFPHFTGESKDAFDGKRNAKAIEMKVRALVEEKNAIWLKY